MGPGAGVTQSGCHAPERRLGCVKDQLAGHAGTPSRAARMARAKTSTTPVGYSRRNSLDGGSTPPISTSGERAATHWAAAHRVCRRPQPASPREWLRLRPPTSFERRSYFIRRRRANGGDRRLASSGLPLAAARRSGWTPPPDTPRVVADDRLSSPPVIRQPRSDSPAAQYLRAARRPVYHPAVPTG